MPIQLLVIDPQNDFCDLPDTHKPLDPVSGAALQPALPVRGAHADMQRLARFIDAASDALDQLTITLDSHPSNAIERPSFWVRGDGSPVHPFTQIHREDVAAGRYRPRDPALQAQVEAYLAALEAGGRYTLMVWPTHCVTGTWGHNLHVEVAHAVARWEAHRQRAALKVLKGQNPLTEAYSAVRAEVPRPDDPGTQTHHALLQRLRSGGRLLVAGEASSHCVAATLDDVLAHLSPDEARQVTLLRDCTSPVSGFEPAQQALFERCAAQGVAVLTSEEALARLQTAAATSPAA